MPAYSNVYPPTSVYQGDHSVIVNAEQLGTNVFSQEVAIGDKDGSMPRPVTVTFTYASTPSSVEYDIYVAWDNTAPLTSYTKVGSTTNVNGDQVTLQRA